MHEDIWLGHAETAPFEWRAERMGRSAHSRALGAPLLATLCLIPALLLSLAGACTSPSPPEPPSPPTAPVAPAAAPPVAAVAEPTGPPAEEPADDGDAVPEGPAGEAMLAYRATIDAYNEGDADSYFAAFTDPIVCFHGESARSVATLRSSRGYALEHDDLARAFVAALTPLRVSDDEVVLVDRGAYAELWGEDRGAPPRAHAYMASSSDPVDQGVHEKVVVMRRVDGAWRIAVETDRAHLDCIVPPVVLDDMPAPLAACRDASRACIRDADATCEECGACNGCNVAPTECLWALAECVGAPDDFAAVE